MTYEALHPGPTSAAVIRDIFAMHFPKAEAEVTRLREALGEVALPCHDYDCDERPAIALAALKEASQ
jgi:hypothetical protein